ncbi:hypothetical protein [Burkholderia ubonensis]|uniref:hypothetical protein n=1 Tax=Burkholderia ubonensis TaxID=101571 RepID=UPI0007542748|nr:hypothetical protein [Burkholderia ubonensis]KUZ78255.1 hypothetical protein WI37_10945 [Burkholderia ubonensis]
MTERPILFSGPMVAAILDGRKTQTRRVVKLPHANPLGEWQPTTVGGHGTTYADGSPAHELPAIWHTRTGECHVCPHGNAGDRLWVRETHEVRRIGTEAYEGGRPTRRYAGVAYRADDGRAEIDIDLDTFQQLDSKESRGWAPSIHMPRWASRITLEITGVRAERLRNISAADARAEGIEFREDYIAGRLCRRWRSYGSADGWFPEGRDIAPIHSFQTLWDGLNAARGHGWDANPWVWVIEFKRLGAGA